MSITCLLLFPEDVIVDPLVSVVIAVYNYEQYVGETLVSILDQTLADFECIIVDDASTDKTAEVIRSFRDPRIRYLRNERNLGQTASLNRGIGVARGRYVARIDADDIAFPERLKLQADFLDRNSGVGLVGTWLQSVDERKRLIRRSRYPLMPDIYRLFLQNLFNWPCLTHPTVMVRREVFQRVGMYDEQYFISQDYDLWLRIARFYPVRNIGRILLHYREHGASLSRSKKQKTRAEVRQILDANVRFFLPAAIEADRLILVRLFLFEKQENAAAGKRALLLLDSLLDAVSRQCLPAGEHRLHYLKTMARLFYAPRLFSSNPLETLRIVIASLRSGNRGIFNYRFLKALAHALLG